MTSNLRHIEDEWILAQFASSSFYIMVQKGNTDLLEEINNAINEMDNNEPGLRSKLMDAYYTPISGDEISFTIAERNYIEEVKDAPLTAIVNPDRSPLSLKEDGVSKGIMLDVTGEIIRRSGLNIELVEVNNRAEYTEMLRSGNIDICLDAGYGFQQADKLGYRLTDPYIDVTISKLYKKGHTSFKTVALMRESNIATINQNFFAENYEQVTYYDSTEEVIDAILKGKHDIAFLYRRCAEQAVQRDVTGRLAVEDLFGFDTTFSMAVNDKLDHRLYAILNKSVASISTEEIAEIDFQYIANQEQPFSLIGFLYQKPLAFMGIVILLLAIIAMMFVIALMEKKRKRELEQLKEEKRRGELLKDALAVAETAGIAKSEFLSHMSHEMRTPLNAIIGFMELARDADAQEMQVCLQNADIAAKQLLSIINDVLDMSAIEAGKMKLASEPFNFEELIHNLTNIYVAQCHKKGLNYATELLTPLDEWLIGDSLRLNRILNNLLNNAVKFTEEGQVSLRISKYDAQDNIVFLRFEVTDSGCGMSENMLERIFKPFEQESFGTTQKYGGSGLGLSIVNNLVHMMSGAIRVESKKGQGTTFIVDLPFIQSADTNNSPKIERGADLRLLLIDDELYDRKYISSILTRMGVRHTGVERGTKALAELKRGIASGDPYNLCLIDWKMPEMNGLEVTKQIREQFGEDVIVIVVSAYNYDQVDEKAKEAGANLFISKPLFQSSLFDLLIKYSGGKLVKNEIQETKFNFEGKRVLVAEDNEMNRAVVAGILRKYSVVCECACDGQEALEQFQNSSQGYYDAILMDIQMPKMNGLEATKAIRRSTHPDAKTIGIIALTADAFHEDIAKTLSAGMNAHVSKPIEPEILANVLNQTFQRR